MLIKKNILRIAKFGCAVVLLSGIFASYLLLKNHDVTVLGYMEQADGLGRQTIDAINLLETAGIDTNYIQIRWRKLRDVPLNIKLISLFTNNKPGKVLLYENFLPLSEDDEKTLMRLMYPKSFWTKLNKLDRKDQIFIAYSMFESTAILPRWVRILNYHFDAVAVPSKYLVEVYKNSGVKIPIFFVPLGMDLEKQLSFPVRKKPGEIFRFGNFAGMQIRKNQISLVKAFHMAFDNRKDVQLIINARYADEPVYKEIMNYINQHQINNVSVNIESLNWKDYNNLLQTIDCFVYISKGEGFSIQPREAMAMGVPVIISDNTAQKDIAESKLTRVVTSDIAEPAYYGFDPTKPIGENFNVKLNDVVEAMKDVYINYDKYLAKSEAAREWVKQFQYPLLRNIYANLVKPKKVVFGTKNVIDKEMLLTNDEKLYKKYKKISGAK